MGKFYTWTLSNFGTYYQQRPLHEDFNRQETLFDAYPASPGHQLSCLRPFSAVTVPADVGRPNSRPLLPAFGKICVRPWPVPRHTKRCGTRPQYTVPQAPNLQATLSPIDKAVASGPSTATQALPGYDGVVQYPQCANNGASKSVHLKVPLLEKMPYHCDSSMPRKVRSKARSPASLPSEMQTPLSLPTKLRVPMGLPSKAKIKVPQSKISRANGTAHKSPAAQPPAKPVPNPEMAKQVPTIEIKVRSEKVHSSKRARVLRNLAVAADVEDVSDVPLEEYCEDGSVLAAKRCRNTCTKARKRLRKAPSGVKRKLPQLDDMEDVSDTPLEENESQSLSPDSADTDTVTQDCPKKVHNADTALPKTEEPLPPVIQEYSSKSNLSHLAHPRTNADIQAEGDSTSDGTDKLAQEAHKVAARFQETEDTDSSTDLELPDIKTPDRKADLETLGGVDGASHETDCAGGFHHGDALSSTQDWEIGASGAPEKSVKGTGKHSVGMPQIDVPNDSKDLKQKNVQTAGCTSNTKKMTVQRKTKNDAKSPRVKRKSDLNCTKPVDATQESCVPRKTNVIPKGATKTIQRSINVTQPDDPKDSAAAITEPLNPTKNVNLDVADGLEGPQPANNIQTQDSCTNEAKQKTEKMEDAKAKQPEVRDTDVPKKDKLKSKQIQAIQSTDAKRKTLPKRTVKVNNKSSKLQATLSLRSMKSPSTALSRKEPAAVLAPKRTESPDRVPVEAECADNSNSLQLIGSVQAESHSDSGVVDDALSKKVEENLGLSQPKPCNLEVFSRDSASSGLPTTVPRATQKRNASSSGAKDCRVTRSKHVQEADTPAVTQASPRNLKKRRASVSELEDSRNLQGLVLAIRGGSAEEPTEPLNKKKRSASLSAVDKAHCVQDLKLLDSISSQGMSIFQVKQPSRSDLTFHVTGGKSTVKQAEPLGDANKDLPKVNKPRDLEDLEFNASASTQEVCSFQAEQPTQPCTVDINANEVEVQSKEDKVPVDTTPTGEECASDTLKTAPSELEKGSTTACKPEDLLDLGDVNLQLHDTMTDAKDMKPCNVQVQDSMPDSDGKKPCTLQLQDITLSSKDVKPDELQLQGTKLESEDSKTEVKLDYLQFKGLTMKSNKKVKKKSSSGTNTSMRSVWCFARRRKTKKIVTKKTEDVSSSIRTEASATPDMTDSGTKLALGDLCLETMQYDDCTHEDILEPANLLDTELCPSVTVETEVQSPSRVTDSSQDCKSITATPKGESLDGVSHKEEFRSGNILEKDATAVVVHVPEPKVSVVVQEPKVTLVALQCKDSTTPLEPKVSATPVQPKDRGAPMQFAGSAATMQPKGTLAGFLGAPQGETTTAALLRSSLLDLDLTTGLSILDVCQTDSLKLKEFRDRARGDKVSKERAMQDVAKAVHGAIVDEYFKRERAVRTLKLLAKIPFAKEHDAVIRTRQLIKAVVTNAMDNSKSVP
ncbi:uncharacterized protein ISCGN_018264 [Ixodes scapularis]